MADSGLSAIAAFPGSWISTLLLRRVSPRRGQTSVATMLLAGIALGAMTGALGGILVFNARGLNRLSVGQAVAHHIGINVQRTKNIAIPGAPVFAPVFLWNLLRRLDQLGMQA